MGNGPADRAARHARNRADLAAFDQNGAWDAFSRLSDPQKYGFLTGGGAQNYAQQKYLWNQQMDSVNNAGGNANEWINNTFQSGGPQMDSWANFRSDPNAQALNRATGWNANFNPQQWGGINQGGQLQQQLANGLRQYAANLPQQQQPQPYGA